MTTVIVVVWRLVGPLADGHATRSDLRRELSAAAVRRSARWTRPSLSARDRRRVAVTEVGVPLHRGPHGSPLWTPLENPTGALAPTQSGKSRQDLVHKALAAPGALLCSTTKPDLLEFAGLSRSRRERGGPVLVFDATGSVSWPARLRWSPVQGCADPDTARRRAEAMVEAASIGLSEVAGNDKVFRDRAKTVLQAYLLAAAHHDLGIEALVRWAVNREEEPVQLLMSRYPDMARNLRKELAMVAETSDAVWMSVRRVLEPLMDPTLRDLCSPSPGRPGLAMEIATLAISWRSANIGKRATQRDAQMVTEVRAELEDFLGESGKDYESVAAVVDEADTSFDDDLDDHAGADLGTGLGY